MTLVLFSPRNARLHTPIQNDFMADVFRKIPDAFAQAITENAQAFESAAQIGTTRLPKLYKKPLDARLHAISILEPNWSSNDAFRFSEAGIGAIDYTAAEAVAKCLKPSARILDLRPLQIMCDDANRRLVNYIWSDKNREFMYSALELAVTKSGYNSLIDAGTHAARILHRSGLANLTNNDVTQFLGYLHAFEPANADKLLRLMRIKPAREVHEPIGLLQSSLAMPRGKTGPI